MVQDLGKRFRELRIKNDMSQDYVASALGVSMQAVSKWENGKSYPDIFNLLPLSDLFHVSLDDLLDKERGRRRWVDKAHEAIDQENGEARLQILKSALAEYPGDYQFRLQLACEEFFQAEREADPARRKRFLILSDDHFSSLRREFPESSTAVDMHARVLAALGRQEDAKQLAKHSLDQDRLPLLILKGEELTRQKRKQITVNLLNLFGDLMREGSHKALAMAETLISEASAEDDQFCGLLLDVHYQHALLCCEEGDHPAALRHLEAAKELVKALDGGKREKEDAEDGLFFPILPPASRSGLEEKLRRYCHDARFSGLHTVENGQKTGRDENKDRNGDP